ncbi:hypothetical protein F4703DRAFT_1978290, partial [Phycomyces blakesleeanus]
MMVDTAPPVAKKTCRPPRYLPVQLRKKTIWDRLQTLDSGLSMADWLAMDKLAAQDIKDGLRFIFGRKKKVPVNINLVRVEEETSKSDSESFKGTESSYFKSDEGERGSDTESEGYGSDDTVYDNKYDYKKISTSQPLQAPILINGHLILAIFDSGASVSVISKTLADKLQLLPNGNRLPLSSLDGEAHEPCEITVNVSIQVAG